MFEVNEIPGSQALQSVGDQDLTKLVVSACEALASRGLSPAPVTE